MYLNFNEVILIGDKSKLRDDDQIIYERNMNNKRILTLNTESCKYTSKAIQYGKIYYDAKNNPCIVPDNDEDFWNDCMLCKSFILPEEY